MIKSNLNNQVGLQILGTDAKSSYGVKTINQLTDKKL